jgi:glycosyltransferase involved in cell wall biosynthesis
MMACGMPCVDLAGGSTEAELGSDGGVELAEADPVALADALEALLGDPERWERRSRAGLELAAAASWERAGEQFEAGLREALREREQQSTVA